jgi:hypothetical protein
MIFFFILIFLVLVFFFINIVWFFIIFYTFISFLKKYFDLVIKNYLIIIFFIRHIEVNKNLKNIIKE